MSLTLPVAMDVGSEFATWACFVHELEKYSKDKKVSYTVGLCNPVDLINNPNSDALDVDTKFKYSYARMVCSQDVPTRTDKNKVNKCSNSGCPSSILICVNKERNALVIVEANLNHKHDKDDNSLPAERQLKGIERRLASVLLRGRVPLCHVQAFLGHLQETQTNGWSGQDFSTDDRSQHLLDLDQLMANNPECVVEFIDFVQIPDIIFFQTLEMKERMANFPNSLIQLVTYKHTSRQFCIVCVIAVYEDMESHDILALCVTNRQSTSIIRHFVETFVSHNQDFCNKIKGLIVDCDEEDSEFLRLFFPQASIAWSRKFIMERFENGVKGLSDVQNCLTVFKNIMNSSSETEYSNMIKFFLESQNSDFTTHFHEQWDSCKKLWVQYEIDSVDSLSHQKCSMEESFTNKVYQYIQPDCGITDIITSLIHMDRNEEIGNRNVRQVESLKLNPFNSFYRSICLSEAADAVICQAAIGESCSYTIHKSGFSDRVLIQRVGLEGDFTLNLQGSNCSCGYFVDTELPCEHIFAWRSTNGLDMCDESLIPLRWQVLGETITLDSLAQSLSQGYMPWSAHRDDRLKALQAVLKDILVTCSSHSYEDMGSEIILLKQILDVVKRGNVEAKTKVLEAQNSLNAGNEKNSSVMSTVSKSLPKKRGRKSKKEKEMLAAKEKKEASNGNAAQAQPTIERRHNLRTNIKHKFVTRESTTAPQTKDLASKKAPVVGCSSSIETLQLDSGTKSLESNDFQVAWIKDEVLGQIQTTRLMEKDEDVDNSHNKSLKRARSDFEIDDRKYKIMKTNDENDYSSNESDSYDDGTEYLLKKRLADEDSDPEEDSEESDAKRARLGQDLSKFLEGMSVEFLQELMQGISLLDHFDERSQNDEENDSGQLIYPVDFVTHACQKEKENLNFIIRNLEKQLSDYNKFAYKVAASLILTAFNTGAHVSEIRESINDWPSHLPPLSSSPDDDVGPPLEPDQVLTVCGYKLDKGDVDTLNSHSELSPQVIHAYLEVLAQRHNGKLFVIPFDIVQHWRNETFGDMLFKNVHFKTFDFLVLPIHCGAEFSKEEVVEDGDGTTMSSHWMVLVADVRAKTVGVLNPRTEDKYLIAANGYMLQWRRYMQIRSVLTGEMLPAWTTEMFHCSKQTMHHTSGALAIMNVEAVINEVPPCVMTEAHINHYVHYVSVTLRDTDRETTVLCVGGLQCQEMAAQDTDWLQCQNCHAWWHRVCCGWDGGGLGGSLVKSKPFYCSPCRQRIEAVQQRQEARRVEEEIEEEEEGEEAEGGGGEEEYKRRKEGDEEEDDERGGVAREPAVQGDGDDDNAVSVIQVEGSITL